MSSIRIEKVKSLLHREIADIINKDVKDPRLNGMISVTEIDLPRDMKKAIIHVSVFGVQNPDKDRKKDILALNNASGFISHKLLKKLHLKYIPELEFRLDDRMEQTSHIMEIMNHIKIEE